MTLLKNIAVKKKIIICCTIHQPSSCIFSLFDKLVIMDKGSIIYDDSSLNINSYFCSINRPLSLYSNPADSFIKIIQENEYSYNPNYFIDCYSNQNDNNKAKIINELDSSKLGNFLDKKNIHSVSNYEATIILSQRAWLNACRNPMLVKLRFMQTLVMIFIAASVFWRLDGNSYHGVQSKIGFAYYMVITSFFNAVFTSALSFPSERSIFLREHSSGMYSVASYFLAKNIVETIIVIFFAIIHIAIVYFCVNERQGIEYFLIFLACILLNSLVSQSIGFFFGSLFTTVKEVMAVKTAINLPLMLFTGKLINESSIPKYINWFKYLTPTKYANEIINLNEFEGNENITYKGSWEKVLYDLNYSFGMTNCFILMIVLYLIFNVMCLVLLKFKIRRVV